MPKKELGTVVPSSEMPAYEARIMTTTEGRQSLPDVLQKMYGDKGIVAFDRYGRVIGVAVPLEAVRMLAGVFVDEAVQIRVQNSARNLLDHLNQQQEDAT